MQGRLTQNFNIYLLTHRLCYGKKILQSVLPSVENYSSRVIDNTESSLGALATVYGENLQLLFSLIFDNYF